MINLIMKLFRKNNKKVQEDNRSMRKKVIEECTNMKFTIFSNREDISDVKHVYQNLIQSDSLCINMCPDQFECINNCSTSYMFCTNKDMEDYHMCTECWKYNLKEYPNDENLDPIQLRNKIYDDIILNRYRHVYNNRKVMISLQDEHTMYANIDNIIKNSEGKFVAQLSNEMEIEVIDPNNGDEFVTDTHLGFKVEILSGKRWPISAKEEDPIEFSTINV